MVPYIIKENNIIVILKGKSYNVNKNDKKYDDIIHAIKTFDEKRLDELLNLNTAVNSWCDKFIHNKYKLIFNDGMFIQNMFDKTTISVDNRMCEKIKQMINEGFNASSLVEFIVKLNSNPSFRVVNELYDFLQNNDLPITDDGCFLAYKRVDQDYFDYHTHTFDNHIGKTCSMLRNQVDDNSENTCSRGLHFCSLEYLSSFTGCRIMIVKVDPRDVVSIPKDYNNTKGRCCKYEVIDEVPENDVKNLQEKYQSSVCCFNDDEDEYEGVDICCDLYGTKKGDKFILSNGNIATCASINYDFDYAIKIIDDITHTTYFFDEDGNERDNRIFIKA